MPFSAEFENNERFKVETKPTQNLYGIGETVFSKGVLLETSILLKVFLNKTEIK